MKRLSVLILFAAFMSCNEQTIRLGKNPIIVLPYEMHIDNFLVTDIQNLNINSPARPLALSPSKNLLYTCSLSAPEEINAYDPATGSLIYTNTYVSNPRFCKSIDTHSSGRVYLSLSNSDEIALADPDLTNIQFIPLEPLIPGITDTGTNDIDSQQVYVYGNHLYVSSDTLGRIFRFNLDSANGDILALDTTWGVSGEVQVLDSMGANVDTNGELLNMIYEPRNDSIYAVLEGLDAIVQIQSDGTVQTYDVLNVPVNSSPHDIEIFNEYLLVTYGALDGTQNMPIGVAVFNRETHELVETLIDDNQQLRNAQGIVVDEASKTFYVMDGYYGAPNDITLPRASDLTNQNIIMKFRYIK